jgi:lipopolysaccharide biosynthesis glycosyltransferase
LKKINSRVSFVFYNGKQAEYDFIRGLKERRGIGDYSRLLIPEIVNNTNKILILDSADIFAIKDLSEIFFFELGNYYFAFSIEDAAGRFYEDYIFSRSNFYPNTGVCLLNIRKFREDKLYKRAFLSSFSYEFLPCPFQDILFMISNYKFRIFPLNFNCIQFYENKENFIKNDFNSTEINIWMNKQQLSPFKYSKEEIVNAALNPVIIHLYKNKPFLNIANKEFTDKWINYAKMTTLYEDIKKKYPEPFKKK